MIMITNVLLFTLTIYNHQQLIKQHFIETRNAVTKWNGQYWGMEIYKCCNVYISICNSGNMDSRHLAIWLN